MSEKDKNKKIRSEHIKLINKINRRSIMNKLSTNTFPD